MTAVAAEPLVFELSGIRKTYGETRALRGLDLRIVAGEILGVAGPNGAGKSTLVRMLAGDEPRDAGEIRLNDVDWKPGSPDDPVAVVHQEPQVWTNLSLGENLLVGRESFRFGRPSLSEHERHVLAELDIANHVDRPLAECSLAVRQRAEIARAIARQARFFLFDEPNSALTEEQSDRLFAYMHDLAARGRIVVLVSHRLAELVAHCARVVVIRDGLVTAEFRGAELTQEAIARELVVGADVAPTGERKTASAQPGPLASEAGAAEGEASSTSVRPTPLALHGWSHPDGLFRDVSLHVGPGEVVAMIGVEGSGAREVVASTAGYAPGAGGRTISGKDGDAVIAKRTVYLPADRRGMLFQNLTVADNLCMRLGVPEIAIRGGFLSPVRLKALGARIVVRFGVRTRAPDAPLPSLSGGNQQKVAIAAAIVRGPAVLALEEPTRGVDVGAKRDIYAILREFTSAGGGVLVYCTEVPEVFEMADRALVVDRGRIVREIRVADHGNVASLAAEIARSEHTDISKADLEASHVTSSVAGSQAAP
jgi:ABC-type sugar transport system ATPase subunit